MTPNCFVIDKTKVVHDTIDGETVVINLDSGHYYALNSIATLIWNWLDQGADNQKIIDLLCERYSKSRSQMETDFHAFIEQINNEGLLLSLEKPIADANQSKWFDLESDEGKDRDYISPEFSLFDDMADFLKVDPIHEVTEQGWPFTENVNKQDG